MKRPNRYLAALLCTCLLSAWCELPVRAQEAGNLVENGSFEELDESYGTRMAGKMDPSLTQDEIIRSYAFPAGWESDGQNLLSDGSFETSASQQPWYTGNRGDAEISFASENAITGTQSLYTNFFQYSRKWGGGEDVLLSVPIDAGDTFLFRGWVMPTAYEAGDQLLLSANMTDSGGTRRVGQTDALYTRYSFSGSAYQHLCQTVTVPEKLGTGATLSNFQIRGNPTERSEGQPYLAFYADEMAIEKLGRVDLTTGRTGNQSLKIVGYGNQDFWTGNAMQLTGGTPYTLTYYAKADTGSDLSETFCQLVDAATGLVVEGVTFGSPSEDNGWYQYTAIYTPPADMSVRCRLGVTGRNTAWFDDVSVAPFQSEGAKIIISANPDVTSMTVPQDPATIAFTATVYGDTGDIDPAAQVTWSVTGSDLTGVSIVPETGVLTITPDAQLGTYTIRATAVDNPDRYMVRTLQLVPPPDLLSNGDFEQVDEAGFPIGWTSDGRNLLPDGSFEHDVKNVYWYAGGSVSTLNFVKKTEDPAHVRSGEQAASVPFKEGTSKAWGSIQARPEGKIAVAGGAEYIMRSYVKVENLDGEPIYSEIEYIKGTGETIPNTAGDKVSIADGAADWYAYETTITTPANAYSINRVNAVRSNGFSTAAADGVPAKTAALYCDDFSLEKLGRTDPTTVSGDGTRSLKIVGYADGVDEVWSSPRFAVEEGRMLSFSGDMKTEAIAAAEQYARIRVTYYDASGEQVSSQTIAQRTGTADWETVSASLFVPAGATQAGIDLVVEDGTGTAWFDNLALAEAQQSLVVRAPQFSLDRFSDNQGQTLTATATAVNSSDTAESGVLVLALFDEAGQMLDISIDDSGFPVNTPDMPETTLTAQVTIPEDVSADAIRGYRAEAFLWDSLTSMQPFHHVILRDYKEGEITLSGLLQSGMVVQRSQPIPIFGYAPARMPVTVSFDNDTTTVYADNTGRWEAVFAAREAGVGHTVSITGPQNSFTLEDVSVGDVWLFTGQSNMDYTTKRFNFTGEDTANIKLFTVPDINAASSDFTKPQQTLPGGSWVDCTQTNAENFSAVGYLTGKALADAFPDVPIGLVSDNVPGTAIERWMSNEARAELGITAQSNDLYNGMIAPLAGTKFSGVVWYQGESNVNGFASYKDYLTGMVADWRSLLDSPELPFIVIQLPGYYTDITALLREAQMQAADESNHIYMTCNIDTGDQYDIHPYDKDIVSGRVADTILAKVYGREDVSCDYPTVRDITPSGSTLTVTFDNVYDGLQKIREEEAIGGFLIAGADGVFYNADASITGTDTVTLSSTHVSAPVTVRYAFEGWPRVNLANSKGIPVAPFRNDTLPIAFARDLVTDRTGNLIYNGGFEEYQKENLFFAGYAKRGGTATEFPVQTADAHAGDNAVRVWLSTRGWSALGYGAISVAPGIYELSVWAKADGLVPDSYGTVTFSVQDQTGAYCKLPDGTTDWTESKMNEAVRADDGTNYIKVGADANGGTYQQYTCQITIPEGAVAITDLSLRITLADPSTVGGIQSVTFDDLTLTKIG